MARRGIFVFYDANGIVDEYVEVLLKSMEKILTNLLIVINGEIKQDSLLKLGKYADRIFFRENKGYDGGAYKDVFLNFAKDDKWESWDEIILFNDTFYGPLFSWSEIFDKMSKVDVDFWGLSRHPGKNYKLPDGSEVPEHIQSYFLVLRKNMVLSQAFWTFWSSMKYPQTFMEAIKYFEIRFTPYFKQNGFQYTSWIDMQGWTDSCAAGENPYTRHAYELISQYQFPIIKRKSLSVVNFSETRAVW